MPTAEAPTMPRSREIWRLLSVLRPYRRPMSVALASLLASSACGFLLNVDKNT